MEISFNIERLVPRFLLADKNGYALAKAIERAFQIAAESAQRGLDIILDPDKMPEWRLDEMAGELNCLYDYNGTLEQKRYWIKNAAYLVSVYGTPRSILNYLEGYFSKARVLENWEYSGDPFHFRVYANVDRYDDAAADWTKKAVERVKNVRSVLDMITFALPLIDSKQTKYVGLAILGVETHIFGPTEDFDPDDETWLGDENGDILYDENTVALTE